MAGDLLVASPIPSATDTQISFSHTTSNPEGIHSRQRNRQSPLR